MDQTTLQSNSNNPTTFAQKPNPPFPPVFAGQFSQQIYASPLPPPEAMMKYKDLGLLEEIVEMTKKQAAHRCELESRQLDAEIKHQERRDTEAKKGQSCAFWIVMSSIAAGLAAALLGYQWATACICAIGLSGIVTAFVKGRQEKTKNQNLSLSVKK
jgi:uncharacterized membrane protein